MDYSEDIQIYERYFRDPPLGDEVLRPSMESIVCPNIRQALRLLGYETDWSGGDQYDAELQKLVFQFQTDYGHPNRDGAFGPGTRRLLTKILIEERGTNIFKRMVDPEKRADTLIFISYKREDMPRIAPVLSHMAKLGYGLWYDKNILGGTEWLNVISEKIAESDVFTVFVSEESLESTWVQREVERADGLRKPIIPVKLEPISSSGGLMMLLSPYQMLEAFDSNFISDYGRAIEYIRRKFG